MTISHLVVGCVGNININCVSYVSKSKKVSSCSFDPAVTHYYVT